MTDRAPLPESNDPHVILGIAQDASGDDVRRAYVQLIKRYRPETHPLEFQRIRKAYDEARRHAQYTALSSEDEEDQDDDADTDDAEHDEDDHYAHRREQVVNRLNVLWSEVARSDQPESALSALVPRLESFTGEIPDEGVVAVHRYLAECFHHPEGKALSHLLDQLLLGAPVEHVIYIVATDKELLNAHRHRALKWSELRNTRNRESAAYLFDRVQRIRVAYGHTEHALAETLSESFVRDAFDSKQLESTAHLVSSVAVWTEPELAQRVHSQMPPKEEYDNSGWTPVDQYDAGLRLGEAWREWRDKNPDVRQLADFIPVAGSASDELMAPRCTNLHAKFRDRFDTHFRSLESMFTISEPLVEFFAHSVNLQPMHDDPESPSEDQNEVALKSLRNAERRVEANTLYQFSKIFLVFSLIACGVFIRWLKWWSVPVIALTLVVAWRYAMDAEKRVYRKFVRRMIGETVWRSRLPLETITSLVETKHNKLTELDEIVDRMEDDPVLEATYWASRLDEPEQVLAQ